MDYVKLKDNLVDLLAKMLSREQMLKLLEGVGFKTTLKDDYSGNSTIQSEISWVWYNG